ncbi:SDR family oxidoreductase [Actinomycetospora atypica]|uniref:SDR family oxidoreductase n=1 Tax=Actinomycetospora atypica TaxID=1290095 RepID=A0ABV9YHU4_9PSEU
MQIAGATALVTGANRGLGAEFTRQLVARGARVYAAARRPETLEEAPGVTPLTLDVTDPASVAAAAKAAPDVDLVVNNAGIARMTTLVDGDLDDIRAEMETNFFGSLSVVRAFAPAMVERGSGAFVQVVSALSWVPFVGAGGYGASKAAAWMLGESVRAELVERGVEVLTFALAATDTDMMAFSDVPKNDPAVVVAAALDGLAAGAWEVLADDDTRGAKRSVAG